MENKNTKKIIYKVSIFSIIGNLFLTIAKVIVGIFSKSNSLISDGVHSGSDVFSTIIVMIGAKLSTKKADEDHPYGHERFESIACIILSMILMVTAVILGYNGVLSIIDFANGIRIEKNDFTYVALGFAIASIVVKFIMYLYTLFFAKKINSTSLKADAYHHLSDSLSSFGSLLGIIGIIAGGSFAILDPIACIIIAIFIIKVGIDILKEGIDQVVDKKAPDEFEKEIANIVYSFKDVKGLNSIRTRQFGNKYYVELEIAVDPDISVREGHDIATTVHNAIENKYDNIKHCMIHVDPVNK